MAEKEPSNANYGVTDTDEEEDDGQSGGIGPVFHYDIAASGEITVYIIPRLEFGIVFDSTKISDTVIAVALSNSATLYGDAGVGTDTAPYACYGINGRTNLYASVNAP